jgi:hypothetical protein
MTLSGRIVFNLSGLRGVHCFASGFTGAEKPIGGPD